MAVTQHDSTVDWMTKTHSQQPGEQDWRPVSCADEDKALKDR